MSRASQWQGGRGRREWAATAASRRQQDFGAREVLRCSTKKPATTDALVCCGIAFDSPMAFKPAVRRVGAPDHFEIGTRLLARRRGRALLGSEVLPHMGRPALLGHERSNI